MGQLDSVALHFSPMDFLSTGIQEVTRRLRRRHLRRTLRVEERGLEEAEIALGREAWRELAHAGNAASELAERLVPLHRLDAEGADNRTKLAETEREMAAQRDQDDSARRGFADELARLETERGPLRRAQGDLKTTSPAAGQAGAVEASDSPHRRMLQLMQDLDQREAAIRERRREEESAAAARREDLQARLRPLHSAQTQLEQSRRAPLRRLGQYLADHEDAVPPAATRHLAAVREARGQVRTLELRDVALVHESRQADPQSLRLSVFVFTTFAVFAALALLLIFRAPPRRDWLPANTQLVVSANLNRLAAANAPQMGNPWNPAWVAMTQPLLTMPILTNPATDVRRVVRAIGVSSPGQIVEYDLFETEAAAASVVSTLVVPHGFGQRYDTARLGGLPIYERSVTVACAQIGPSTIAVGPIDAVEEMIRVRLGLSHDLKLDEQFYEKFQRLDRGSAFRFVTRRPGALVDAMASPLFAPELLGGTRLLGFAARAGEPIAMVLILRAESEVVANRLASLLRERGGSLLRLAEGTAFAEPPVIEQRAIEVEFQFVLTGPAAQQFLTRIAGVGLSNTAEVGP